MIEIKRLSCGYTDQMVLKGMDLCLREEDFAVLAGPNGAGKSTLLYAMLGFITAQQGSISFYGKDLHRYKRVALAKLIAFVPQESFFEFDYPVAEIVLMGRYPYLGVMQSWLPEDRLIVDKVLAQLGLESFSKRYFSELSGGEKQQVLIARALAQDTKFIFLDETLSQLDINHQIEIMNLLREIHLNHGKGVLLISHNLNLAANYAGKMIFLKDGCVLADGNPKDLMQPQLLRELFGIELQTMINPLSGMPNIIYPGKAL
ncbi:MAG: ABC transporter ATP-binding protein [Candidatus Cloacimonadaceae bacterium]|nr:ABC transporter ATP-binding protein [Candidatus Cloacimonadaceae bacterium]MDP3114040.1 ABC transporter ATP-binding protein [Candidatus Cloacimonadaceae bacterium]